MGYLNILNAPMATQTGNAAFVIMMVAVLYRWLVEAHLVQRIFIWDLLHLGFAAQD